MEVFCYWKIKKLVEGKRMTKEAFAEACGVDRTTVYRWMNGKTAPGADRLGRAAGALGLKVADFYAEAPGGRPARRRAAR